MLITDVPRVYAPAPGQVQNALLRDGQFERVYQFCRKHGEWPAPDLSSPVMASVGAFADLDLPQLPTLAALAEWLFLPLDRLEYLADVHNRFEEHGETSVNHYHYVLKSKKFGGFRVIEAPKQQLKTVQRHILNGILDKVPVHDDAFGFVKGRSCLDCLDRHVGEQIVVCFDLENFFPSIHHARIFGLFRCLGYPHSVAKHLSGLCTTVTPKRVIERLSFQERVHYSKPHLPQGSPASPALANHAAFTLDKRLAALARRLDANFSRYADDISFSGEKHVARTLMRVVPEIVQEEGFNLNARKTRISSMAARQVITGVVVNRHLNVRRETFDELKAIIHACAKPEDQRLRNPVFRASLLGRLEWVEQINPDRGRKLTRLLSAAMSTSRP